jgi:fibro-slime domain-containing protein
VSIKTWQILSCLIIKFSRLGSSPYLNYYLNTVCAWDSVGVGGIYDSTIPVYRTVGTGPSGDNVFDAIVEYDGPSRAKHDTAFKNFVIRDSLTFVLVDRDRGIYRFEDSTFFPLDNRGFGNESRDSETPVFHNYSFTMRLHTEFTYRSGLQFIFRGDDDVWTYVNNRLAIDLGGIHNAESDTIDSDDCKEWSYSK